MSQDLPIETSRAGDFARMLMRSIGSALSGAEATITGAFFLGLGDGLAEIRNTLTRVLDQAFVASATQLLAELERLYGLGQRSDLTDAQRQARLVAKVRAARAGTPQSIISAIRAVCADPVAIYEMLTIWAAYANEPRLVFTFAVSIPPAEWNDPVKRETVTALVEQMKPAHTLGWITTNADQPFLTDDPNSLTDRDSLNG